MTLNNKFDVLLTTTFKRELLDVVNYIRYNLKEPNIANKFYKTVIKEISTLNFMPERYMKIIDYGGNNNLRKFAINNYIIIYEVNNVTLQVFILHIFHCSQNYINKL